MPMHWQNVDVPFTGGLNQGVNDHLRGVGEFSILENCYYDKDGELRIRGGGASLGTTVFTGGNAIATAQAVMARGNELLLLSGKRGYAWSPETGAWKDQGTQRNIEIVARDLATAPTLITSAGSRSCVSTAKLGDYLAVAYWSGGEPLTGAATISLSVYDLNTYTAIVDSLTVATAPATSVLPLFNVVALTGSNSFAIVYGDTATTLSVKFLNNANTSSPALSSATSIASRGSGKRLHARAFSPTQFVTATANATQILVELHTSSAVSVDDDAWAIGSSQEIFDLVVDQSNSRFFVVYGTVGGGLPGVAGYSVSGSTITRVFDGFVGATPVGLLGEAAACLDASDTDALRLFYEDVPTALNNDYEARAKGLRSILVDAAGSSSGDGYVAYGVEISAGPFAHDGQNYIPCTIYAGPLFTGCLVGGSGGIFSRYFVSESHQNADVHRAQPPTSLGAGKFIYPASRQDFDRVGTTYNDILAFLIEANMSPGVPSSCLVGDALYVADGVLRLQDGRQLNYAGFNGTPSSVGPYTTPSSGTLNSGDYGLAFVHRWMDALGNLHESVASTAEVVTASLTDSIASDGLLGEAGARSRSNERIDVYLTQVDGTVFLLKQSVAMPAGAYHTPLLIDSDPNAAATILYSQLELSNICPPTFLQMASDGNVVLGIPCDRRNTLWASRPLVRNTAVGFSDEMVMYTPEGGDNTAVSFLDRPILFKADQIRYLSGQAPDALGLNGYSGTVEASRDAGCDDWRSLVRVQGRGTDGLVFKAGTKGFHLFDRSMQVDQQIGRAVKDYNSQTVLSATVVSAASQARFCMSGGDVLVLDYHRRLWSVFPDLGAVASCVWQGKWVYVKSDGTVVVDDGATWTDPGSVAVTAKARIGWARNNILGWQRSRWVGLLGTRPTSGAGDALTIRAYREYDQGTEVDELAVPISSGSSPIMHKFRVLDQKCTAFAVEIEWESTAALQASSFTGLTLEMAAKNGLNREAEQEA